MIFGLISNLRTGGPTPALPKGRVLQDAYGRDIFLYLSASNVLTLTILSADKYKNMSLPYASCNTLVPTR